MMADGGTFITKSDLAGLRELEADGRPLLDSYATLAAALSSRLGRAAALLLAEPVVTRGNGAVATSVAWYASGRGEPVRLSSLAPNEREPIEADLRARLADVTTLLHDPDVGPLLGGALFLPSTEDIWLVDGRPVLTNWGLAPESALRSPSARDDHVARTIGAYVSLGGAPAVGEAAWQDRYRSSAEPTPSQATQDVPTDTAAMASTSAATAGASLAGDGAGGSGEIPPPPPSGAAEPSRRGGWIGLMVATLLAGIALAFVLIPGVLRYPPASEVVRSPVSNDDALRLQLEVNRSLEERRQRLEQELAAADCTTTGALVIPPSAPGAPPLTREISPQAAVPPQPKDLVVAPDAEATGDPDADGDTGPEPQRLETVLDQATVLVLVPAAEFGIGSGFFVGPDTIVTNRHVVENREDRVLVTNPALGRVLAAEVVAETPTADIGSPDFALLRVDPGDFAAPALAVTTEINRLDNVVASGFPGIVVRSDARFRQLLEGDATAAPSANMQSGAVTVIQPFAEGGSDVVLHSAEISGGNSGGPLVDTCGRVVAVNTFVNAEQQGSFRRLNYALHGHELQAFLDAEGVRYRKAEGACTPRATTPAVAAAAPAEPQQPAAPGAAGE